MAWLQSSFTSHQLLGDNSNNTKKNYKKNSGNKDSDPDKSDTPLLQPDNDNFTPDWLKTSGNTTEKKQNITGSSKSIFTTSSLFEKTLGNKNKMQTAQNTSNYTSKPGENMKLLPDEKKNPLFDKDEEDEEDSDDEWSFPRLGGYQKVRPCVE